MALQTTTPHANGPRRMLLERGHHTRGDDGRFASDILCSVMHLLNKCMEVDGDLPEADLNSVAI